MITLGLLPALSELNVKACNCDKVRKRREKFTLLCYEPYLQDSLASVAEPTWEVPMETFGILSGRS